MKKRDKKPLIKAPGEAEEKVYKSPRAYARTVAKIVKREREQPSLFNASGLLSLEETHRTAITRNAAILGTYLFQLLKNEEETIPVRNLTALAELFNTTNSEIKLYLLALGGFTYPVVTLEEDSLNLSVEQLFKIQIRYGKKTLDRYKRGELTEAGTNLLKILVNEAPSEILITPNRNFLISRTGKGQGYTLLKQDKYVKLSLQLTDLAYKLQEYSSTQSRSHKLKEPGLITALGIEAQVKKQGAPYMRGKVHEALEELKTHGYLTEYSYDKETSLYKWIVSGEYIQHGKLLTPSTEPGIQ
jgi:hypothetical protein